MVVFLLTDLISKMHEKSLALTLFRKLCQCRGPPKLPKTSPTHVAEWQTDAGGATFILILCQTHQKNWQSNRNQDWDQFCHLFTVNFILIHTLFTGPLQTPATSANCDFAQDIVFQPADKSILAFWISGALFIVPYRLPQTPPGSQWQEQQGQPRGPGDSDRDQSRAAFKGHEGCMCLLIVSWSCVNNKSRPCCHMVVLTKK